jgi:hypothetical protein
MPAILNLLMLLGWESTSYIGQVQQVRAILIQASVKELPITPNINLYTLTKDR